MSESADLFPAGWTPGASRGESLSVHLPEDMPSRTLWRGKDDGEVPLRWEPGQVRYPDLTKIDEDAWPAVLIPFPHVLRLRAARNQYLGKRVAAAVDLVYSMPPSATDRARAAVKEGTRIPSPTTERRGWRQMTVRIPERSYEDLAVAAELLGTRPAELARMFVLNGTRRALADQDADSAR